MNREGRAQLAEEPVRTWCQAHDIGQAVTSRIYALLLNETSLRDEIARNYFTDWTLLERLALELSGSPVGTHHDHEGYRRLRAVFESYLDDPLGERQGHPLAQLAQLTITVTNEDAIRQRLRAWILEQIVPAPPFAEAALTGMVVRLEFALLTAVLQDRLALLFRLWPQVEGPLQLDGSSSILFHRPPSDYNPVIPVAPMGNVLAFQYIRSADDASGSGDLRFFRCLGVGRWLLLHLHELYASDGLAGPHVLLLSGTSWAGKSPAYHVQAPVNGVLRAPEEEIAAIARSTFTFLPIADPSGRPITVSGASGSGRAAALRAMLHRLAGAAAFGGPSMIERERERLPEGRRRILLVVGSYDEAALVGDTLEQLRPDWRGQVVRLAPDDEDSASEWRHDAPTLQRGIVHRFARTDAWILIAPLLAIERGHNILNERDEAALGAAFFLVRPHPRPDDLGYAIQSINRWAVDKHADPAWLRAAAGDDTPTLDLVGAAFRRAAYRRWRRLLDLPMIYSTLPEAERDAVTWSQLVTIWQVIGRLVRGGQPARIFFCDAAFARRTATAEGRDRPATSLLVGMRRVLRPYFDGVPPPGEKHEIPARERAIVQALYGPLQAALQTMGGIADDEL